MTQQFLMMDIRCDQVAAEAHLNDVPLVRVAHGPGNISRVVRPVNEFVVPGENHVRLLLGPGPHPSVAATAPGMVRTRRPATASLVLSITPEGAFSDGPEARKILEIHWTAPGLEFSTPLSEDRTVGIDGFGGEWTWTRCRPMFATAEQGSSVALDLVRSLRDSLHEGDPEPYIRLALPRLLDVARAYHLPADNRVNRLREQITSIMAEGAWGMDPISPETFDPRPCAQGRLLQCMHRDWLPALRTLPTEAGQIRLRLPTYLGFDDGALRIVL